MVKPKCNHARASNTTECLTGFIDHKLVGILKYTADMPIKSATILVFDCGYGLALSPGGAYWVESSNEVEIKINEVTEKLTSTEKELKGILKLAGKLVVPGK